MHCCPADLGTGVCPGSQAAQKNPSLANRSLATSGGGQWVRQAIGHSQRAGRPPSVCQAHFHRTRSTAPEVFLLDTMNNPLRLTVPIHCWAPRIKRPFLGVDQRKTEKESLSTRGGNTVFLEPHAFQKVPATPHLGSEGCGW